MIGFHGATTVSVSLDLAWLFTPALPTQPSRQQALLARLRHAILQGQLRAGTQLPASRTLATTLGLARNTVLFVYEQLIAEGYLHATRRGTRVAALPCVRPAGGGGTGPGLSQRARHALPTDAAPDPTGLPLALGVPDMASFPIRAWRSSLDVAWRQASARHLGYAPNGGEPALREAIASHLNSGRGLAVSAAQVIITAGTQSGLDLCARLLADAGDTAWVEDPGYPAARTAFTLAGLRLHGVPVDAAGMAPAADEALQHPPRLIFVTPSHQFPTGVVMPVARRLALIEQARAAQAWIIEDDYDSEFRRTGAPLPALYGLQPDAPVVYAGTFSKTLFPALRLGYLVVPEALAEAFAQAGGHWMRPGQSIEQLALANFIRRGRYTTHLRHMRPQYAQRRDALRAALERHFSPRCTVSSGEAGLHLLLSWESPLPPAQVVERHAHALGVAARALDRYQLASPCGQGLVLGYGATPLAMVESAVARLAQAWQHALPPHKP